MIIKILKKNTFAQDVFRVLGVKSIVFIFGMLSSVVSARALGPGGKGVYAVATALIGICVQFGNLGIHSSNTYFLAKDKKILPAIVGNSVLITLLVTLVAGGGLMILWYFPDLVSIHGILLVLSFLYIPIQLYNMFQENYFLALDKIKKYSILEMLNGIIYPILLIVVSFCKEWQISPETAVLLSILATCIVLFTGVLFLKEELGGKVHMDKKILKETLPFGFKSYLSCLITYLVLRVDILMLDAFLDEVEVGLYSLAVSLADIVNMIAVSVAMLLFPKLSGMSQKKERRKFIYKTLKYMSLIMLTMVVGTTVFSEIAIIYVYGEAYYGSVLVFRILMPGIFFWSLSSLMFNYFSSENRIGINIVSSLVGLGINLVLNWILIPRYGINGAAMASLAAYIVVFILLMYYLRKAETEDEETEKV